MGLLWKDSKANPFLYIRKVFLGFPLARRLFHVQKKHCGGGAWVSTLLFILATIIGLTAIMPIQQASAAYPTPECTNPKAVASLPSGIPSGSLPLLKERLGSTQSCDNGIYQFKDSSNAYTIVMAPRDEGWRLWYSNCRPRSLMKATQPTSLKLLTSKEQSSAQAAIFMHWQSLTAAPSRQGEK